MKIGFILRSDLQWGGDLNIIYQLINGIRSLGHEVVSAPSAFAMADADFIFLTLSIFDQRAHLEDLNMLGSPFGVFGFHEDYIGYSAAATGFRNYLYHCLGYEGTKEEHSIDALIEMPHIIQYFGEAPKHSIVYNHKGFQKASILIANSSTEARNMARDFPGCKSAVIPVVPGIVNRYHQEPDESFLKFSGLESKSYGLQVGRLEMRKNQLATILACRNLDFPLVFIATKAVVAPLYEVACLEAAAKWRKAPTLFISEWLKPIRKGSAQVISMPNDEKLPVSMLVSAYHHAGIHIHPAFQELPGLTYLEAARLGTPTVGSSWCTITDYFFDPKLGHAELDGRIVYCKPHHIEELTRSILKLFGKHFPPLKEHPVMKRNEVDAAQELLQILSTQVLQ